MAFDLNNKIPSCVLQLQKIDVEDLQYVEQDLCFYELVSLGFLLYGDDHVRAQFILQKLLVLSNAPPNGATDLLRQYATTNHNWQPFLIEALSIIKAKRVLRKLGFQWEELRQHFLPHIPELSVYINPILKALFVMSERMTSAQAGRLVQTINEECKESNEHLRFYDSRYLEIFLLDWLSCRIIRIHSGEACETDLQVLLDYLKLNELDQLKELILQTINNNSNEETKSTVLGKTMLDTVISEKNNTEPLHCTRRRVDVSEDVKSNQLIPNDCYVVRRESAGIVLIINQKTFHEDTDPELKHLLPPKKLTERRGTDVDKARLKAVFSSFGYDTQHYDNLTHIELLRHIRETVMRSFQYDSLIVCILSHGIDGAVYGCNSVPVEIAIIEQIITADILQGKPKMLIVQACQKDESLNDIKKKKLYAANSRPDVYVDVIKAMSTVPGYASIRHTSLGSWFIQSICDKIDDLADRMQVSDVLIAVTKAVTDKRGDNDEMMVPITNSTLRKHFFLPKRK